MKNKKYIFLFASVLVSQFFVSCNEDNIDKTNAPIPYEAIGGYENSDDIAKDNLVSKFSFENNLTDKKGNITNPIPTNISYAAGAKGNAYNGSSSQQRYFVGNANTAITGLNSLTFSFWMNTANSVPDGGSPGQGKGAQGIFSMVRPTEFWGALNVFMENQDNAFPNRIRLKINLENGRDGVAWRSWGPIVNIDDNLNKWIHVVLSYDAKKSIFSVYLNGELATNLGSFPYAPANGVNGTTTFYADNPGVDNVNNAPKYGDYKMTGTNGKIVFGTHQFDTTPALNNGGKQDWATSYAGLLDEFRIYNVALPSTDVRYLYKLEKDNR